MSRRLLFGLAVMLPLGCGVEFLLQPETDAGAEGGAGAPVGGSAGSPSVTTVGGGMGGTTQAGTGGGTGGAEELPPFSNPTRVAELNTSDTEDDPTLREDLLEIYFNRNEDVYRATRPNRSSLWSTPTLVAELSSSDEETTPELSSDGLTFWVSREVNGDFQIYRSTRVDISSPWSVPVVVDSLNSSEDDFAGNATADGRYILIASHRADPGTSHFFYAKRSDPDDHWPVPLPVLELTSEFADHESHLSADGLLLWFASEGFGGLGGQEILRSERPDLSSAWSPPVPVEGVGSATDDSDPWLSPDMRTIYFERDDDIWVAER